MNTKRTLTYAKAINEALYQAMEYNPDVIQIGSGVNTPWYVGGTMDGLLERFGEERVIDTPVSENSITGIAAGAAMVGKRPVLMFPRMDFMYYAMDQLCNHVSMWNYSLGQRCCIPLTIRAIINRGGEQAAQHSQALHAVFMHIPGFRVVMPATPYDAKGMLLAAISSDEPVLYIEDRWLYSVTGTVPENIYQASLDSAQVVMKGEDLTIISSSYLLQQSLLTSEKLRKNGYRIEVIDLRSIKPIDRKTVIASARKTGRVLVVDGGWKTGGVAAEIMATIMEDADFGTTGPVKRLTLPDLHAPSTLALEQQYYLHEAEITKAVLKILKQS